MGWNIEIHTLDVGKGESCLIVVTNSDNPRDNRAILIDGGDYGQGFGVHRFIQSILAERKMPSLYAMICTHYDADHNGGLTYLLSLQDTTLYNNTYIFDRGSPAPTFTNPMTQRFNSTRVTASKPNSLDEGYRNYIREIYRQDPTNHRVRPTQGINCQGIDCFFSESYFRDTFDSTGIYCKNMSWQWENIPNGLVGLDVLWWDRRVDDRENIPPNAPTFRCLAANTFVAGTTGSLGGNQFNENNMSLAFLLEHGDFKFYSGGDLPSAYEDQLAQNYLRHKAPIPAFKCSHHGANGHTSAPFLNMIQPTVAFISAGPGTSSGHPGEQTVINLNNAIHNRPPNHLETVYLTGCGNIRNELIPATIVGELQRGGRFIIAGSGNDLSSVVHPGHIHCLYSSDWVYTYPNGDKRRFFEIRYFEMEGRQGRPEGEVVYCLYPFGGVLV